MVSHWLWCLCRHAFQVGPVCLHVCGFSLIKLSARLPRSQVALVVTALSSRRLLLVVEVVEEIVERVAAEITSCSTVVTALTTELSTWLPRTLQLVLARARLGPTTLPKKYRRGILVRLVMHLFWGENYKNLWFHIFFYISNFNLYSLWWK